MLSSLYDKPKGESAEIVVLMRRIDELFLKHLDEFWPAADLTGYFVLSYWYYHIFVEIAVCSLQFLEFMIPIQTRIPRAAPRIIHDNMLEKKLIFS